VLSNASRRYLVEGIEALALNRRKMGFVAGPRQVGKTTLAKSILSRSSGQYFTWEDPAFRKTFLLSPPGIAEAEADDALLAFDEIHKARHWKRGLKGIYDIHGQRVRVLVTGSARLNVFRKGADSLLGRYLLFHLHPLSVGELRRAKSPLGPEELLTRLGKRERITSEDVEAFERLLRFGGFPEPYFGKSPKLWNIWRRSRTEKIVREDLRDLSRIPELSQVEMLVALLPDRVGSMLSIQSLARDLEVAHTTARRWINYLDELYYCYEIKPYAATIARSIRKEGKLYLWDWSEVENEAARYENLIAGHLAKACDYWTDTGEGRFELRFLRNKERAEIDFLVMRDRKPWLAVEAKLADESPSPAFKVFGPQLGNVRLIQVVRDWDGRPRLAHGVHVSSAVGFLKLLP
jgi:uncharacterized protein